MLQLKNNEYNLEKIHRVSSSLTLTTNNKFGKFKIISYLCIMKERVLASVRVIKDISPIEGADKIEVATVDGWKVVVAKDVGHKVGDMVIYCEIDSFLPIREEFEFLRKSSYKKMGDEEGFRLRTIKLKGQISQGLILPLSILENVTGGKIINKDGEKYLEYL